MGSCLLSILLILASIVLPSTIKAYSDQIHVTATVLPSPVWVEMVRANSQTTQFGNYIRVKLSDGHTSLKNQAVLLVTASSRQTAKTDSSGIVWFEQATSSYELFYIIMGQNIPIFPTINTYHYLSYRFISIAKFSSTPSLTAGVNRVPVSFLKRYI
jgi:hypothetical protein